MNPNVLEEHGALDHIRLQGQTDELKGAFGKKELFVLYS